MAEPSSNTSAPGQLRSRRVRKSPEARRTELLAVALQVMDAGGLVAGGMSDVADAAGVSKGLLYHYFPRGRTELVEAVAEQLLDELAERISVAASLPFSPLARLEQVLAALFGFFDEQPLAYRLLVEGDGLREDDDGVRQLARVRLVSVMTSLMADTAMPADDLLAVSTTLLDQVLGQVEACRRGLVDPEQAWRTSCARARALFGSPS